METNLFLSAVDADKAKEIQAIKNNKAFALRIIRDLDGMFHTNFSIKDDNNLSRIETKRTQNSAYGPCNFVADKNGIRFLYKGLGYYKVEGAQNSHIKAVGPLYEKYMAESRGDLDDDWKNGRGVGDIKIEIPFVENDINLSEKLRDIIYFMEKEQYDKRF